MTDKTITDLPAATSVAPTDPFPTDQGDVTKKATATLIVAGGALGEGANSVAIGTGANASGTSSVAIGHGTLASGLQSTALGFGANAAAEKAISIGYNTLASGYGSIAQGYGSQATATDSMAFGGYTYATGQGSTAVGVSANAAGLRSVALGAFAVATGKHSMAFGASASDRGRDGFMSYGMNGVSAGNALLYGLTNAATPARLTADGAAASASNTLPLANNTLVGIKQITIVGRQGNTDSVVLQLDKPELLVRGANAAATAIPSASPAVFSAIAGTVTGLTTTATIAADTTNGSLNITVTPPDGSAWQWRAEVELVEAP